MIMLFSCFTTLDGLPWTFVQTFLNPEYTQYWNQPKTTNRFFNHLPQSWQNLKTQIKYKEHCQCLQLVVMTVTFSILLHTVGYVNAVQVCLRHRTQTLQAFRYLFMCVALYFFFQSLPVKWIPGLNVVGHCSIIHMQCPSSAQRLFFSHQRWWGKTCSLPAVSVCQTVAQWGLSAHHVHVLVSTWVQPVTFAPSFIPFSKSWNKGFEPQNVWIWPLCTSLDFNMILGTLICHRYTVSVDLDMYTLEHLFFLYWSQTIFIVNPTCYR